MDVQQQVKSLEGKLGALRAELDHEVTDRKAADDAFQAELIGLGELLTDSNAAAGHAIKYLNDITGNFTAKALMLQESIQDFNAFLRLPERSNTALLVWDAAFTVLATATPALRLSASFRKLEEAARLQLDVAKALSIKGASLMLSKTVVASAKVYEVADVIEKANDVRSKVGAAMAANAAVAPKLNSSRTAVRTLIADRELARRVINTAIDALQMEFSNRIHKLVLRAKNQAPYAETLTQMAARLMPPVPLLQDGDLDMLGRYYLHLIMMQWIPRNVTIVTTGMRGGRVTSIEGMNNTQQEQFWEWFGPSSFGLTRDSHGMVPMWHMSAVHNGSLPLYGAKSRTDVSSGFIGGFG